MNTLIVDCNIDKAGNVLDTNSNFYVSVDGGQAPKVCHKKYSAAFMEAKRIADSRKAQGKPGTLRVLKELATVSSECVITVSESSKN